MDEIGQLRIFVSEKFFPIYHEISKKQIFKQNSEFFVYCSFLGEKMNEKKLILKKHELCRAITLTENDKTALKSLYYKVNKSLDSIKEVISEMEKFAEGGLEFLINNDLKELVYESEDGVFYLQPNKTYELQITLVEHVLRSKK